MSDSPTRSAVRKAGSAVRKLNRGEIDSDQFKRHLATIEAYRNSFGAPLEEFHNELIEVQRNASFPIETTRRLKRVPTILDKLLREPGLDLSRMQDIAGCRSVVAGLNELQSLRDLVTAHWNCFERNYVATPRQSGYRAIHLIISLDGIDVELQLRTQRMQDWAQTVEAFSAVLGDNYKQDGEHTVQVYLSLLSEAMSAGETGASISPGVVDKLEYLRPQISALISNATEGRRGQHE